MILQPEAPEQRPDARWYLAEKDEVYRRLNGVMSRLAPLQADRQEMALMHARMWGAPTLAGMMADDRARRPTQCDPTEQNVCRNIISAVVSRITKNRPKPTFLTNGADYEVQEKAEKLEKVVDGCFYAGKLYEKAPVSYRDGCIFGTGIFKVYPDFQNLRPSYDRVFEFELMVDPDDARYGSPRSIYYETTIDKRVAIETYAKNNPALAEKIEKASAGRSDAVAWLDATLPVGSSSPDRVRIREAWHLPSGKNAKDGRHVICIENADILDEPWKRDRFPFAIIYWTHPLTGFWGDGLCYEAASLQMQVNKTLRSIYNAHDMNGKGYWLVANGSRVEATKIGSGVHGAGTKISYTGTPPQYYAPQLISGEMYPWLTNRVQTIYENNGISQLAATSQKPAGLNSGEAIRAYADEQSERFIDQGRAYENWFLQLAELTIDACQDIAEYVTVYNETANDNEKLKFTIRTLERDAIFDIDWSEVDMPRDSFILKVFPASMLPQTPAGRLAFVRDMTSMGMDQEDAFALVDIPDLDQYSSLRLSSRRVVEMVVEKMLKSGEYTAPEPFDNATYGLAYARNRYERAKERGYPEARLRLLRLYMMACWRMLKDPDPIGTFAKGEQAPEQTPTPPAGPGGPESPPPEGPPEAPPPPPEGVPAQPPMETPLAA